MTVDGWVGGWVRWVRGRGSEYVQQHGSELAAAEGSDLLVLFHSLRDNEDECASLCGMRGAGRAAASIRHCQLQTV